MEDFALDIMIGKGPSARSIRLDLPKFTLIGATTRAGMLTSPPARPLWHQLPAGTVHAGGTVHHRAALGEDPQGALRPGGRFGESPGVRGARRASPTALCAACATLPRWKAGAGITLDVARRALKMLEVDELGLDHTDRMLLRTMTRKIRRRAGGAGHAGRLYWRGRHDHRGRVRAILSATGLHHAHAARPRGRPRRLRASWG